MGSRRLALGVLFFAPGVVIASWVTRTPAIRDALDASTAEMGLAMFGLAIGSMTGILFSGSLVARFGTRPVLLLGASGSALSLPVVAGGSMSGELLLVAIGLSICGLGLGSAEVAMNVDGGEVEQLTRRSFLPLMHGCFSLGTAVGAAIGMVLAAVATPVAWHLFGASAACLVGVLLAIGAIPRGVGQRLTSSPEQPRRVPTMSSLLRDRRIQLIGVIILAMALAEGTANDWLPLIMVDGHGFDPAWSSGIFAIFAISMTIGRFAGSTLVNRLGRRVVLAVSGIAAGIGLAAVSFSPSPELAVAAVVLWGLGASLGFPVALSAAGDSGPDSAARLSLIATVGYIAFLVGPPVLGYFGEHLGLRAALLIPFSLVAVAVAVTFLTPWDARSEERLDAGTVPDIVDEGVAARQSPGT
ncbi:MFS transporter [Agromyces bracchium]